MAANRYTIEYIEGIQESLVKIPKNIRARIKEAIEKRLMVAPTHVGKPLSRRLRGHRRIRVGDYRIIYRVFEEKVLVLIIDIDHRKDIYK